MQNYAESTLFGQMTIGYDIDAVSVPSEIYSVRLGYGVSGVNQSVLHLRAKGKLELIGDEAQFILPNYQVGSPATAIPSTTIEGGMIWDASTKELKIYDGTAFTAIGAGGGSSDNWLIANNGVDFGTTPIATGSESIALGDGATTGASTFSIAIGTDALSSNDNGISIGRGSEAAKASVGIGFLGEAKGSYSVAIGRSAKTSTTSGNSVAIGNNAYARSGSDESTVIGFTVAAYQPQQVNIGHNLRNGSTPVVTTDVAHSVKLGSGLVTNRNVLHLFSKGKLELYGDEAQFIFPNYITGSIPATTNEGGAVWDSTGAAANNWLIANNGVDFTTAPLAPGTGTIVIGDGAKEYGSFGPNNNIILGGGATIYKGAGGVAIGRNAFARDGGGVAIGDGAEAKASHTIAIGENAIAAQSQNYAIAIGPNTVANGHGTTLGSLSLGSLDGQTTIGTELTDTSTSSTTQTYDVRVGYGITGVNLNVLHMFDGGKLELNGANAQFVLPNYLVGSPALPAIPSTTNEGGMIWDASTKELKIYDGTAFTAIGGGGSSNNWIHANSGADFAIGNNANTTSYRNVVIGKNATSSAGNSTALGYNASAGSTGSIVIGSGATTAASASAAIGSSASASGITTLAIGDNATAVGNICHHE